MDGPRAYHIKWSQKKERQISNDIMYMWNLRNNLQIYQMSLSIEQKPTHRE